MEADDHPGHRPAASFHWEKDDWRGNRIRARTYNSRRRLCRRRLVTGPATVIAPSPREERRQDRRYPGRWQVTEPNGRCVNSPRASKRSPEEEPGCLSRAIGGFLEAERAYTEAAPGEAAQRLRCDVVRREAKSWRK